MTTVVTRGAASAQALGYASSSAAVNYIEDVFSTYLYSGNSSTQTITNGIDLSGKGGLVWMKNRSADATFGQNYLSDTARGITKYLVSNNTDQQFDPGNVISSVTATGFNLGNSARANNSGVTYASWTFREQPKFFDIVTYTGNGAARTIAHNLGSAPGCIIVKNLTTGGFNWPVYHRSTTAAGNTFLNLTQAYQVDSSMWNSTEPTSAVFSLGANGNANSSGDSYVAYLFAHNAGGFGLTGTDNVISCGSYTGDGTNGQSVSLGYEPQWLLIKRTDTANSWFLQDNMRPFSVTATEWLQPNTSNAESAGGVAYVSPTATGFTFTSGGSSAYNASGGTYIYIAIRRGPMKVPTSGTSVFTPVIRAGTSAIASVNTGIVTDAVWETGRSGQTNFAYDRLRGPLTEMSFTSTNSEANYTSAATLTGFDSMTGFTVGADPSSFINGSGINYINWAFRRAPGFFDVVCWTGTNADQTLTHNLTVAPELIIYKTRATTSNWYTACAFTGSNYSNLQLNLTTAGSTVAYSGSGPFSAQPTTTQFSVGQFYNPTSAMVAYLFATVAGVSKVGSYTGNGTTQTIDCGFGAGGVRFVLIKRTDSTGDWYVYDTARGMTVLTDPYLRLNSTAAETATLGSVTTVSTGFALNSAILADINVSAGSYIFLAIA